MRRKGWPAALAAAVGLVMVVAGVAGLLASCSPQLPPQPPRGTDTVAAPTVSSVTSPATAPSSTSASPSPTGLRPGVLKSNYDTSPPVALPVSLTIPVIGVQTRLLKLGLVTQASLECTAVLGYDILPQGALNTCPLDSDPHVAGWYTGSSRPGAVGPAIIAGHVDFQDSANPTGEAVFGRLYQLRAGDSISVTEANGSIVEFRVTNIQSTPKNAFPAAEVYGKTPYAELILITCDSSSPLTNRHFQNNLIVYATEVTSS